MFRKLFLVIAPILFLSGIIIQIYCLSKLIGRSPMVAVSGILWIVSILWMLIMAEIYGGLYKVKWALIIEATLFVLMIVGGFMKMQHWPGAELIISVAPILFGIIYLIHFFMKKRKKFIDISKLLFVISSLFYYFDPKLRSDYNDAILASWLIFVIILFITTWIYIYRFKETTAHPEIAENGNDVFNYTHETSESIQ